MFDEDDLKSTRWRRLRHYKARIRMWSYNVSRRITTTTCVFLGVLCILLFLVVFTPKLEVDLIPQKASISGNNKLTASLLIEKKDAKRYRRLLDDFPKWMDSDPTTIISHSHALQLHTESGLDIHQLDSLIHSKSNPDWQMASVTAIINLLQSDHIQRQLDSVLAQTMTPNIIWVVCSTEKQASAESTLLKYRRRHHSVKMKVVVVESGKNIDQRIAYGSSWLQVAQLAPSDYIWVIDNGASPGTNYLQHLLQLMHTDEYHSALLGTSGIILPDRSVDKRSSSKLLCVDNPGNSRSVDIINDVWLLRTPWVAQIARESRQAALAAPLGHYISQALNKYAAIPSIVIPHGESNHSLLADTTIAKRSLNSCQYIKEQLSHNDIWQNFLVYRTSLSVSDYKQAAELAATPNTDGSILFVVDGPRQARALRPLFCRFHVLGRIKTHVVVTGESRGMTAAQLRETLEKHIAPCIDINILDLDVDYGELRGLPAGDSAPLASQVAHDLSRLLSALRPRLVVNVHQPSNPVFQGSSVASSVSGVTAITLPLPDVRHTLWMADLPMVALQNWYTVNVNLVIITDRRPHSLSRLIRSATNAHYLGDKVSLSINMEQTADKVTRLIVANAPWPHGPKNVRHRIRKGGLMPAIVESWYPTNNDDYAIFLEDDVEVSPYFYLWVKYAILRYRYGDFSDRSDLLFGISLYSPRNTEMGMEGRRLFHPDWVLNATSLDPRTPFLLQVPCSWGAVYFPEHWREFHEYVTARLVDLENGATLNISVPESRSNRWKNSWKRYFIEMIYLRGYSMLYPNFQNFTSFSTNHLEFGTHVKHERKAIEQFLVPLMETDSILQELPRHRLPPWNELPVLDLWAKLSSNEQLIERGKQLHSMVSACPRRDDRANNFDPQDILCPWPQPDPTPEPASDLNSQTDPPLETNSTISAAEPLSEVTEVSNVTASTTRSNATIVYVTVYVTEMPASPTPETPGPTVPDDAQEAVDADALDDMSVPDDDDDDDEVEIELDDENEDMETSDMEADLENLEKLWIEQKEKASQEDGDKTTTPVLLWQDDDGKVSFELADSDKDEVDDWLPENQGWPDEADELAGEGIDEADKYLDQGGPKAQGPLVKGWPTPMPFPNLEK
ncbi:hypothetical protein BGW37DRAFT_49490 [Umbelopsis sp. PMI_123]|nr:hypothetical protein BGW37DRAFT_49490 [Umbelopsis sp. PMI_123]